VHEVRAFANVQNQSRTKNMTKKYAEWTKKDRIT